MFIFFRDKQVGDLLEIQGISEDGAELLGAVGVETCSVLAQSDPGSLLEEIEHANSHLELVEQLPDLDQLIGWIEGARNRLGELGPPLVTRLDEVVELVSIEVLSAYPVSKESILKHEIGVGDVPVMDEFLEERDLYVEEVRNINTEPAEIKATVREIAPKTSRVTKASQESTSEPERAKVEPLQRNAGFDIRKTATPEINAGKKMHSRGYIRGVLHPQPGRVKFGAFLSVLTILLLPLSFLAGGALLLFKDYHPLVIWSAAVPAAFVVFGLMYFMFARPVKCRVCGQPIFQQKSCRRNPKAHHIPLLGYILPTSIQLLLFHWFRCIYCGTSVRLKE